MIVLVALGFFVLLFVVVLLWILIPAFHGLPPVPTNPQRIQTALKLVNLKANETLYDLGAGDGRVLLIAARDFGAKAVGLEIGPIQADLKDADVVFVYATSKEIEKLASHLKKQMRNGSRLISISADFSDWEPSTMDEVNLIFVYEMSPTMGSVTTYMLKQHK
jgi:precorrin-6B methylase 2